jgi:hypothetical protein
MRDFTSERLTHHANTVKLVCDTGGSPLLYASAALQARITDEEGKSLVVKMVERWNACADALAELERGESLADGYGVARAIDARAILRRAIYGEG